MQLRQWPPAFAATALQQIILQVIALVLHVQLTATQQQESFISTNEKSVTR